MMNADKTIIRARFMLLGACYSISAVAVIIGTILLYDYFVDLPVNIGRYILLVQVILSFTAAGQLAYNERLLKPLQSFLAAEEFFSVRKAVPAMFGLLMALFTAAFLLVKLAISQDMNVLTYFAVSLISSAAAAGFLALMLKSPAADSETEDLKQTGVIDAALKLPFKSAAFSLCMWLTASVAIGLAAFLWVKLSPLKSITYFAVGVSSGVLAFPMQYLLFKIILEPLHQLLLERGLRESESSFRITIRRKLIVGLASVVLFAVGFYGLMTFLKTNSMLRAQVTQLISRDLEKIGRADNDKIAEMVFQLASEHGAVGLFAINGEPVLDNVPAEYRELEKELVGDDMSNFNAANIDDLVILQRRPEKNIVYGLIFPYEHFRPYLNDVRNRGLVFAALTLLIVAGLAIMASRDIARPIESMREKVRDIEKGNFAWSDDFLSDDESADLVSGFRSMAAEIEKQLERSKMLVDNINMTVQHLSSSAGEMRAIAREQASGSLEQATAIQQALTTAEEIAASAHQISESAGTVNKVADDTRLNCSGSSELIDKALRGMGNVREQVDKVAHNMLELGARSQKIGAVVEIIQEISEQTNLLSLNAGIEASGAGEEGRRFGVVAKEIRRLAGGTGDATRQIKLLITEIQKATTAAIMQVEESTKAVEAWAEYVIKVGDAFKEIESMVESASRATGEITTNTRQQTTACEQMAGVISEVKQVADRVVISSKETEQSMADIAELTGNLRELTASRRDN